MAQEVGIGADALEFAKAIAKAEKELKLEEYVRMSSIAGLKAEKVSRYSDMKFQSISSTVGVGLFNGAEQN